MASRNVSPGGALLRTSRLFSIPAPIPPPPSDITAANHFSSDTATSVFPTHQVITTLSSSRKRGDWGLKRPLPLKSTTKSSTPMITVKAIDTIEQITDFRGATNHGITLRKFQELGMPVTMRRLNDGAPPTAAGGSSFNLPQPSVFEDTHDFTDIKPEDRAKLINRRWKFSGPWLAGMTQGDFTKWLAKEVRPKRHEFREFLKAKIASDMHSDAVAAAQDKGEVPPTEPVDPSSVTEEQLTDYLRRLRHNNQELYNMVGQFLDLAPLEPPKPSDDMRVGEYKAPKETSPFAEFGPPVTHPSAGLSYLRTNMYMPNHPIYGPQKNLKPVEARVLTPRRAVIGAVSAKIGVAGFIANPPSGDTISNTKAAQALYSQIDPNLEGGAKVWVQPQRASVDSMGRVILAVGDASAEEKLVAQELLGKAEVLGTQRDQSAKRETAREIRERYRAAATSSASAYGL
ncbi:hypothetical protein VTK26DRAFT_859 [Humicola hyalothermophila]